MDPIFDRAIDVIQVPPYFLPSSTSAVFINRGKFKLWRGYTHEQPREIQKGGKTINIFFMQDFSRTPNLAAKRG